MSERRRESDQHRERHLRRESDQHRESDEFLCEGFLVETALELKLRQTCGQSTANLVVDPQ